jgi:hypothetical protein
VRGRRNQVPAETRLDYDTFQHIARRLPPELAVKNNQDEEDKDPDDGRRREPLLVHPVKQSDQYDRYVAEQPGDLLPYHLLQRPGSPVDIGIRLSKLRRGKQVSIRSGNTAGDSRSRYLACVQAENVVHVSCARCPRLRLPSPVRYDVRYPTFVTLCWQSDPRVSPFPFCSSRANTVGSPSASVSVPASNLDRVS